MLYALTDHKDFQVELSVSHHHGSLEEVQDDIAALILSWRPYIPSEVGG